jgi:hypothetical protein
MKRTGLIALIPALLFVSLLSGQSLAEIDLATDKRTAIELLPESCLAVAQMPHPDRLLTTLTEHAVWKKIKDQPEYQAAVSNPGYLMFLGIRTSIETQIDMKWREAYDTVLGGGITVAFDPETQGVVGLIRAKDGEKLAATAETLIQLGRQDAKSKGREQLPEDEYRSITIYGNEDGRFAIVGPWLVMVNKSELGKKMIDTLLDGSDSSLSHNEEFTAARASIDGEPTLWAWLDLGTLRDAGFAEALEKNQTDNPAVELLVGGILTNLRKTQFVTGALYVTGESTRLALAAWTGRKRRCRSATGNRIDDFLADDLSQGVRHVAAGGRPV